LTLYAADLILQQLYDLPLSTEKNMKSAGKIKSSPDQDPASSSAPEPENSFYSRGAGEESLYDAAGGSGRGGSRSSRGTPARRRETTNRAGNRQIFFLLLKIVLIPAALFGAYLGLKAVVGLLEKPSEEQQKQWTQDAERMQQPISGGEAGSAEVMTVDLEFLKSRMSRWEQADRHLRSAAALERREIDEEAAARLEQALRFAPDNREIQSLLLDIRMRSGSYEEAIPLCVRLLDQNSGDREVKMQLLKAFQETGRMEAVLFLTERMMEQEPERLDLMEMAAYAHASLNQADDALEMYNRILERDKGHLLALEGAGYIYQWQTEWKKAVPYYMELVRLDPKAEHYRALAHSYAQMNEPGKAAIFLGQAASLYGGKEVGLWLRDPGFDAVRESVDFRSLSDRVVGVETRKAIEAIRRREVEKSGAEISGELDLPLRPDLELLRPRNR
jgi:tetratricopeptide (TPR) repeat protein